MNKIKFKSRVLENLNDIYSYILSDKEINNLANKIISLNKKTKINKIKGLSENDILLITYADTIIEKNKKSFSVLNKFLNNYIKQTFSIIHILPFYPSSSDGGFSVIDISKLIANKLKPLVGKIIHSNKLRIGYFAQHQLDELTLNETPMGHVQRERPSEKQGHIRARLDGFGISVEQADIRVKSLSGGQKARLSLLLASLDAPHLLILDEPTNHLDIESREALVEALTKYSGAVIIVSHDIHLLSLVADRLWLAKNGTVKPYEYDLETYRKSLLSISSSKKPEQLKNPKTVRKAYTKDEITVLKNNLKKSEERVEKLLTMEEKISKKLADPKIYSDTNRDELVVLNTKYAEVRKAMTKAEDLWEKAQKKLDNALKSKLNG